MRIASQIMILCGYYTYEKKKNRFKQKIQNILKKEKKLNPNNYSKLWQRLILVV